MTIGTEGDGRIIELAGIFEKARIENIANFVNKTRGKTKKPAKEMLINPIKIKIRPKGRRIPIMGIIKKFEIGEIKESFENQNKTRGAIPMEAEMQDEMNVHSLSFLNINLGVKRAREKQATNESWKPISYI